MKGFHFIGNRLTMYAFSVVMESTLKMAHNFFFAILVLGEINHVYLKSCLTTSGQRNIPTCLYFYFCVMSIEKPVGSWPSEMSFIV